MEASHRSIHPNIQGASWWVAVLIAVTGAAIGYALDAGSGSKELTGIFASFYIAGCMAAVLAVRQSAVFTAVVQPPLILFCTVPGAYWLFHGGTVGSLKDLLINCGYPLIERFPLMLGTAGGVLLIGLVRWYFGMTHRTGAAVKTSDGPATATERMSVISGIAAKLNALLARDSDHESAPAGKARSTNARLAQANGHPAKNGRAARTGRTAKQPLPTRSRHPRAAEAQQPTADRPRRRRPAPTSDFDPADQPHRTRRARPQHDPELRRPSPREREMDRDPRPRRSPHERPTPRSSRFDPHDAYGPSGAPARATDPYDPHEQRRRTASAGPGKANSTHHPISQVRYRGSGAKDGPRPDRYDRPRPPRRPQAESWEYDI